MHTSSSFVPYRRNYGENTQPAAATSTTGAGASTATTAGIAAGGDIAEALIGAYRDVEIAKITKKAPSKVTKQSLTSGGGLRASGGGSGGSVGLSGWAWAGIGVTVLALGVGGYYLLRQK